MNDNSNVYDDERNVNDLAFVSRTARDAAIRALTQRGVTRPAELVDASTPTSVLGWCRWWDEQPNAGTGLLAKMIRGGEPVPGRPGRLGDYANGIRDWLRRHFPELDRPPHGPHPAAIVAVIHLHWRYGKGRLTRREHGDEIRRAVAVWDGRSGREDESR